MYMYVHTYIYIYIYILDAQVGPYGANLCSTLLICGLGTLHLNDANSFLIISNGSSLGLVVFGHVFVRKNLTWINRKSIQHPLNFFPKTPKNPPETLLGGLPKKRMLRTTPFFRLFSIFADFRRGPARRLASKICKKSKRSRPPKYFLFVLQFFIDFSRIWLPKTRSQSNFFELFSKTSILRNRAPV